MFHLRRNQYVCLCVWMMNEATPNTENGKRTNINVMKKNTHIKRKNYVEIVKESVIKRSRSFMCKDCSNDWYTLDNIKQCDHMQALRVLKLSHGSFYHWFRIKKKKIKFLFHVYSVCWYFLCHIIFVVSRIELVADREKSIRRIFPTWLLPTFSPYIVNLYIINRSFLGIFAGF